MLPSDACLQAAATPPHKASSMTSLPAEAMRWLLSSDPLADCCVGFALLRLRPHAVPRSLPNRELPLSKGSPLLNSSLEQDSTSAAVPQDVQGDDTVHASQ